jgi:tetratricopeptide (TPR) repeat protein
LTLFPYTTLFRSVDAVRSGFGAELAVAVTASRDGDRIDYVVSVIDTSAHRQLRSAEGSLVRGEGDLLDRLIREIVGLLDLAMTEEAQAALKSGVTASAEAASLYAQGLQAVPIMAGRSALERHDQERSLEEAVELFTRAIEIDPDYAYAHASLGEAYLRLYRLNRSLEHFKLAEAHCRRALTLDDLVGQVLLIVLDSLVSVFAANQTLDVVKRPGGVDSGLVLGGLSDESLLVSKGDDRGSDSVTELVGDDLDLPVLEDADTGEGGSQIDTDDGALVLLLLLGGRQGEESHDEH